MRRSSTDILVDLADQSEAAMTGRVRISRYNITSLTTDPSDCGSVPLYNSRLAGDAY